MSKCIKERGLFDFVVSSLSVGENIYVMLGLLFGLRLLTFFALTMAARLRFL